MAELGNLLAQAGRTRQIGEIIRLDTIRSMTLADLEMVLGWAAEEGWNPGLDDAQAFLAADPQGFLLKLVDGEPVSAISVVNHAPNFAFLGLYICRPGYRGAGHGLDIWNAGLRHAGERCVGLDGVPDQQANYRKSGFLPAGKTVRYQGAVTATPDISAHSVNAPDVERLLEADRRISGVDRRAYLYSWFETTPHRRTVVLDGSAEAPAFGTIRACSVGRKIGPFVAGSETEALSLLANLTGDCRGEQVFVDVPEHSEALAGLLEHLGFTPVFETARMYLGRRPKGDEPLYHGVCTLELG